MSWDTFHEQQPRVTALLSASLRNHRLAHAYLFTGPRGVGKKAIAIHVAKSIFCQSSPGDACGDCLNCRRVDGGNHPDVHVVTPDGTSLKIDQIRALQKEMGMRSLESLQKLYIIEHVDKMTTQAANSLLKFLEEPPTGVTALLLTENSHAILPTILSRCQIVSFAPLPAEILIRQLVQEGVPIGLAQAACQITAHLDDARELSQSEWFAQLRNLVIQLTQDLKQRGTIALFSVQDWLVKTDKVKEELPLFLDLFILWLRDILYVQVGRQAQLVNVDQQDTLAGQAYVWSTEELLRGIELAMDTKHRLDRNANPQLAMEKLVLQIQGG